MTMIPTTMRALEVSSLEGPSSAKVVEKPVPKPRPGYVLVRVEAAGLNFADTMQTRGLYVGGPKAPYLAGSEGAGEIVAVGEGVSWKVGARVIGMGGRAFAEYAEWPAFFLLPLPEGWSFAQGAAFPVQWLTAHGCLRICGRLEKGESVLIHAAAGGVGVAAVTLAKHYGARIFATASTDEKLEVARSYGADELINYKTQNFAEVIRERTQGRGVDLILEMVGGETFRQNLEAVVPYGRIVVFGAASGESANINNVNLIFRPIEVIGYHLLVMAQKRPELFQQQIVEMTELIQKGVIVPAEPTTAPLSDAVSWMEAMERRETTGKIVFVPGK